MRLGLGLGSSGQSARGGFSGGHEFTPAQLGSLGLWLRSDIEDITITGAGVSSWRSKVGGHELVQATDPNRPTYSASDANFAGKPSLNFNGTSQWLRDVTGPTATSDSTWAVVLRSDTADATERWVVETNSGTRLAIVWTRSTGATHHMFTTSFAASVPDANATQDLIYTFDAGGGTCRLHEKGVDRGTVAYGGGDIGGDVVVGAVTGGSANMFDGQIAEVIIFNRILSAGELTQLRTYFGRYGIT